MDKVLEFGKKTLFLIRVLSGYEERRIRSYRLQLQRRIEIAQERKAALRRIPEQAILSEIRRMVEEMQAVNRKLEETEAAIEEYFKPIDKEAEIMMNIQLEGEAKNMREMVRAMHEQASQEKAAIEKMAKVGTLDTNNQNPNTESAPAKYPPNV
eukprot:TRINITY_DN8430_c0_g1_i1.p1 TRINITY_DN8430_c0_g1~~TRINITY_DN8430_c0_g1_i1.p1  ORF type:complete len:154 (+),score=43.50 TRINITY_DN8430_c0_g1_i1:175-636(+)